MTYFCGIVSCKMKCFGYPKDCKNCKKAEYTPANSPNVVCFKGDEE